MMKITSLEEGFRLTGAPSETSLKSKARIDALFEDSKSICSSTLGGLYAGISTVGQNCPGEIGAEEQKRVNSAVQARIEAMFASVEAENGKPGECAAAILPVRYLGAAPVGGRVASVRGLQEPLRDLLQRLDTATTAELEVSRRGLTYRTSLAPEKTSPFRRIAVWSALRLRCKRSPSGTPHHAFLPLVGEDPTLHPLSDRHSDLYRTMRGLRRESQLYPPIFAVVMRRPGAARLLECHAFACNAEEDAVAAAATLYRSLLADLEANRRRPRQADGVGCVSLASSVRETSPSSRKTLRSEPPPRPSAPHPVRPPRLKKSSVSSCTEEAPRRRPKQELGSEDILEARSRKTSLSSNSASSLVPGGVFVENDRSAKSDGRKQNEYVLLPGNGDSATEASGKRVRGRIYEEGLTVKMQGKNTGNGDPAAEASGKRVRGRIYGEEVTVKLQGKNQGSYAFEDAVDVEGRERFGRDELRENGKRRSREELYEEHFRDADKIYSLGQGEVCAVGKSLGEGKSGVPEYAKPMSRKERAGSEPPGGSVVEEEGGGRKMKKATSEVEMDRGDLMTRVELPRRGSFLHSGSNRKPNGFADGTPLGFTELFDEFRNQEGLSSVDDILAAIIDPEGMSFNDLKPLYKEFLLKLAATLTRDELYQRSASIMRRRRRHQRRRSTRRPCLLGRAIRRSVSRLKGGPTEFTSVVFPARRLSESFGSSSSCDARTNRKRVLASRLGRRKTSWKSRMKSKMTNNTSEDSDTGRRPGRTAAANRSSSGYVSCSECSYDSESCTCVSADKCYCSMPRRRPTQEPSPGSRLVCSCDTDSCSESNKCYCARKQPTILEQLRQRGIVPSGSTSSRGGSPERVRTVRSHASSRSLEFLKVRPSSTNGSTDNLALDYDLFSPGKTSRCSSISEKILVVSARDPQGRLVYVGGAGRGKKSPSRNNCRSKAHQEALSIKKSAEIAAVFSGTSARTTRRTGSVSSMKSSASLEAGLGYLP